VSAPPPAADATGLIDSVTADFDVSGPVFRRFVAMNMDSSFRRNDGKMQE
jgi:hypothetical protein